MPKGMHPNSLKALKDSAWKPGQSGNPAGRKSLGPYYRELINSYALKPILEVQGIADSPDSPSLQRAAALSTIRMINKGYSGSIPLAANDLDRNLDRDEGKPMTRVAIQHTETLDPDAAKLRLIEAMASWPPEVVRAMAEAGNMPLLSITEGVGVPS